MIYPSWLQSALLPFLRQNNIFHDIGWSNYMKTVNNPAAIVIDFNNEQQVQLVMKQISVLNAQRNPENKITVRATAGWADRQNAFCCFFPWQRRQRQEYNEGFSFSQVVGGRASASTKGTDVILRFSERFHSARILGSIQEVKNPQASKIHQLPAYVVEVSAGMQLATFCDFLRTNNLSLTSVSMIPWVTPVGLAGTGGHGPGQFEGAFSSSILEMKVCDADGTIRILTPDNPDFEQLRAAHSGLLGVVLSIKIRAVQAFNLSEKIDLYRNSKEMEHKLGPALLENDYFSILGMPSAAHTEIGKTIPRWQVRTWNYTTENPTVDEQASYAPGIYSFTQQLEVQVGEEVLRRLVHSDLKALLVPFMALGAAQTFGVRGTKPRVDFENKITHPQVSFPKTMHEVGYMIPVNHADAGALLEMILQKLEHLIDEAAQRGEYPVTLGIYARYIKGTNGGLSVTATKTADEHVLVVDIATHQQANGINRFEYEFMSFLKGKGLTVRHHPGKDFPYGVTRYAQFLEPDVLKKYLEALERWYTTDNGNDGKQRLEMSPFLTPYLQQMLDLSPALTHEIPPPTEEKKEVDVWTDNDGQFLERLQSIVNQMPVFGSVAESAKKDFLEHCQGVLSKHISMEHTMI